LSFPKAYKTREYFRQQLADAERWYHAKLERKFLQNRPFKKHMLPSPRKYRTGKEYHTCAVYLGGNCGKEGLF
jgi:hypothetical protein